MGVGCCNSDIATQKGQVQIGSKVPSIEIEYFDCYGRGLQLRLLAWYNGIPYKDTRRNLETFGQRKAAGMVKFGSLPNIYLSDGT